ncbi:hypothetical protein PMAYCL1PPCAC_20667, partial [Pristionchus mayeri]
NNQAMPTLQLSSISPFEGLPNELVREIVDYIPESVFSLRKCSRLMKSRVDDFVLQLRSFTPIGVVRLHGCCYEHKCRLDIVVLKQHSRLFRLYLLLLKVPVYKVEHSRTLATPSTSILYGIAWNDMITFGRIAQCIAGRIRLVFLYNVLSITETTQFIALQKLFGSAKIQKLKSGFYYHDCNFTNEPPGRRFNPGCSQVNGDHIMRMVQEHGVEMVELQVDKIICFDPEAFMLEISKHVRSLKVELHQLNTQFDWAPLICEMFGGKLDKLQMTSPKRTCMQSDADALMERLPMLGKKLWFKISIPPTIRNDPTTKRHDHIIKIIRFGGGFLTITHLKRELEHFDVGI